MEKDLYFLIGFVLGSLAQLVGILAWRVLSVKPGEPIVRIKPRKAGQTVVVDSEVMARREALGK